MDIVLVLDKSKVIDDTGKYKIIQEEELSTLNFEELSNSSLYVFLDFEFITIKKELPTDFTFCFYDSTFLPIYRIDFNDFNFLLECFSLKEIIKLLRETEIKEQEISKEQVLVSYQNNLAFLEDDYFDYFCNDLDYGYEIELLNGNRYQQVLNTIAFVNNDELIKNLFDKFISFLKKGKLNFYYCNGIKMLNGNIYQQVLNSIAFVNNNELIKSLFDKFISFIKENVDFDKLYEFVYDKEFLKDPGYTSILFIKEEAAYKLFDALGYFPICR